MHFYRFTSLLLLILMSAASLAQKPQVRVNWYYTEGETQVFEAWLKTYEPGNVHWRLQFAQVEVVRLAEGREKQELEFLYEGDVLTYTVPENSSPYHEVYLRYTISWSKLEASPFVNLLGPGLVLNVLNMEDGLGNGTYGELFPAIYYGSTQGFQLALKLPDDLKLNLPLELDFRVEEPGLQTLFYKIERNLNMCDFYLALGDFRRFEPEDIAMDIEDQFRTLEDERIDAFQGRYTDVINYVGRAADWMFTREGLLGLSGIAPATRAPEFPRLDEVPRSLEDKRIELAIIQEFFPEEWPYHWIQFARTRIPDSTWDLLLNEHLNKGDTGQLFWQSYLEQDLHQRKLSWADSNKVLSTQDSLWMARALYFLKRRKPLHLELNYRMNFETKEMLLLTSNPDTNLSLLAELEGFAYLKADTIHWKLASVIGPQDTLFLPLTESPRAIYLENDARGLIIWEEKRPLNFLLYDLSQRNRPLQRRAALLNLLETANPRLRATVVGIALDSGDAELQHLALDKVSELRPDGRLRLQSTLEALADQNGDVKLKQKAKSLLQTKP